MQDTVLAASVPGDRLAFVAHPDTAKVLAGRQRFTGTYSPIWQGGLRDGSIGGVPAASSTVIPTG